MSLLPLALAAAAQLKTGRYLGYLALDGQDQKLGAIFDTYVVQPNDLSQFPQQNAILKLTLGGPGGSEYEAQVYEGIRYDFDNGVLSLDGPGEDLVATAGVTATEGGGTLIDGPVFVRSAGVGGKLHLEFQGDEPTPGANLPPAQYRPALQGQYRGRCGARAYPVLLQLETARGLADPAADERRGLYDYLVRGRLGVLGQPGCSPTRWCAQRTYLSAAYDYALGRLTLAAANGTDECDATAGGLSCTLHVYPEGADHCDLTRDPTPVAPAAFAEREYFLKTTPAQRAKLPDPAPPQNSALIEALQGNFTGNLFNETTGTYQNLRLNVMASTSSANPHNQNQVYVTATALLHFGGGAALSREFWSQPFAPRSFYRAPGFTLESPQSDAFLQVIDWRVGYVRGVLLSHKFGRVGTFELIKGSDVQPPPADVAWVPSVVGAFADDQWSVQLQVPVQQPQPEASTLNVTGAVELVGADLPRLGIARGAYDFYRGSLAWLSSEDRLITGRVKDENNLALLWPSAPLWGVWMWEDHDAHPFTRGP